jgi:hypothetical protein
VKLWLDAKREPEVSWVWAKTAHCAIAMLRGGCVERVSFAPDQHPMVEEVLEWMIENESRADRSVHRSGDGARRPRGLIQVSYPRAAGL